MAVRKIPDVETTLKANPNPDAKELWENTDRQKEIKPNSDKMMKKKKEEEFKPKALNNDVYPHKKRLVKTMIFHYMVEKISVFFHGQSSSARASKTHMGKK